jgi:dipeptidyl aminopeptidase/acylaminoacyl peptidase
MQRSSIRTERRRDNQQWILDWMVKTTGRVQNFANDERQLPVEVKSYRMIPRTLFKVAHHYETIAAAAEAAGHRDTAAQLYWRASEVYREAQHSIFVDDHPEKIFLHGKHMACYDKVVALSGAPVETVEIPWEGVSIQARFHTLPDRRRAPTILFIPGMDMTKEAAPNPLANPFARRGMNVLAIDGPGQGISNLRKIRVDDSNYERAASACLDYLLTRAEVDPDRIGVCGISFGSHWGPRLAALDRRVKALATSHAVYGNKRAIFEEASPRFKQMFMYMAGIHDEEAFDAMAERMTTAGYGARITCPSLMVTGEYDPLCHLEDAVAFFEELAGPKEMWVFENEFHRVSGREGIAGMDIYPFLADWLLDALNGKVPPREGVIRIVQQHEGAGPYAAGGRPLLLPGRFA